VLEHVGRREQVKARCLEGDLLHRSQSHVLETAAAAVGDGIGRRVKALSDTEAGVQLQVVARAATGVQHSRPWRQIHSSRASP